MADDISKLFAENIVNTKYENIPAEHFYLLKQSMIDTLGTMFAGYNGDGVKAMIDMVNEWGGKQEASIYLWGGKVPVQSAAMINAIMSRALDFDDNEDNGVHPTAALLPTALAVSEWLGGVSGKDLLTAFTLGRDIGSRINFSNMDYHGFDPTPTTLVFGTAAVAGKLLGLNSEQMWNALGFAFSESGGSYQSNVDGVLSVHINQGLTASRGIVCARMAQKDLSSIKNIFGGIFNYHRLFANNKCNETHLTKDLGKLFYGERVNHKRWPSCAHTQTSTDLAVEFAAEGVDYHDIDEIIITLGPHGCRLVGKPFELGENPAVDTQFNVRYCIANSLVHKRPEIDQFNKREVIENQDVFDLIKKISLNSEEDYGYNVNDKSYFRADLELVMKNGQRLYKTSKYWKGYTENKLSMDDIIEKYWSNVKYSRNVVSDKVAAKLIEMILHLEDIPNCNEIVALLTP